MPKQKVFIAELANLFEAMLTAAKHMMENRKDCACADPEDRLRWLNGGALLFRALNLGACIVWAARQGFGETVAVLARVLAEMEFNVAHSGEDLKGLKDYAVHCTHKHREWLEHLIASEPDETVKSGFRETASKLKVLLQSETHQWERQVSKRAKGAGLERDYLWDYLTFSQQVHTSSGALDGYVSEEEKKFVVNPKIPATMTQMYLGLAMNRWFELVLRLFRGLAIKESAQFGAAIDDYNRFCEMVKSLGGP
jgi:hypothetical protein